MIRTLACALVGVGVIGAVIYMQQNAASAAKAKEEKERADADQKARDQEREVREREARERAAKEELATKEREARERAEARRLKEEAERKEKEETDRKARERAEAERKAREEKEEQERREREQVEAARKAKEQQERAEAERKIQEENERKQREEQERKEREEREAQQRLEEKEAKEREEAARQRAEAEANQKQSLATTVAPAQLEPQSQSAPRDQGESSMAQTSSFRSPTKAGSFKPCKFGDRCKNPNCTFYHPSQFALSSAIGLEFNTKNPSELVARKLPSGVTREILFSEFSKLAPVSGIGMPQPFRGTAFIKFQNPELAQQAMRAFIARFSE